VHRDIMDGRYLAPPFSGASAMAWVAPGAKIEDGARIEGPCFIDEDVTIKAGARIGPYSVIGRHCHIDERADIEGSILWPNSWIGVDAKISGAILGRHCHAGRSVAINDGAVFGDKSVITDYSAV